MTDVASPTHDLSRDDLLEMQRRMLRVRLFDEAVKRFAKRGEIAGSAHLSIGQEAEVVGACSALRDSDWMTGNHRSHGHPIGKGAALGPLMAEIFGKRTGVCKGKGRVPCTWPTSASAASASPASWDPRFPSRRGRRSAPRSAGRIRSRCASSGTGAPTRERSTSR